MEGVLSGWDEIAKYLRIHARTAQRYELSRGLPVHRAPGGGAKAPVFAVRSELDNWLIGVQEIVGEALHQARDIYPALDCRAEIAVPVLNRIRGIGRDTILYRRDYVFRFDLKRYLKGVQANLDYRFELCNAADQTQPYIQEVTVDDSDQGYVESMSLSINGQLTYNLKQPAPVKKYIGYASYQAPKQLIAPNTGPAVYLCSASWVIRRTESDIWYNHMILPTVGVKVETHAPAAFEITPPFSIPGLVMKAEHLDIAWHRRY